MTVANTGPKEPTIVPRIAPLLRVAQDVKRSGPANPDEHAPTAKETKPR